MIAGDFELAVLVSSSRNSRALTIASADWPAKVSSSSITSVRKLARAAAPDHQHADDLVAAQHRNREHRAPSVLEHEVEEGSPRSPPGRESREVGRLGHTRPTRVARSIVIPRNCSSRAGRLPKTPRTWKASSASSYSRIEPPSVLRVMSPKPRLVSRTALLTMRSSTSSRSRLEPTASSTSRSASSCATLSDKLGASGFQARAPGPPDAGRSPPARRTPRAARVRGRRRRDVGAPHGQHADDVVLQDHRCRKQGAKPGQPLKIQPAVIRVGEDVGNLMGAHVLGRATDGGQTVPGDRVLQQVLRDIPRGFRRTPARRETRHRRAGTAGRRRAAQARGVLEHGVQDGSGVGDVAAERREDFAARRRLLSRIP